MAVIRRITTGTERIAPTLVAAVALFGAALFGPVVGGAHPGGTDDEGCHTCRTNCEKWDEETGERHCHDSSESEGGSEAEKEEASEQNEESGEEGDREGPEMSEGQRAYVDKVLDGDTLLVRVLSDASKKVRVRVLGIDCPESHKNPKCRREGRSGGATCEEQIPKGRKAAGRAAELVKHEVVRLESKGGEGEFGRGGYGRLLAYVRLEDGRDFGKVLVGEGHCEDYGDAYPHPRHEEYEEAQRQSS